MQDIAPFFRWREEYVSEEDENSPFFEQEYDESQYSNRIYNYYIHPQWDDFGSQTLYLKILFADYDTQYAIIELLGEWNDAIGNDVRFLKRNIVDTLVKNGIYKYILICENVLIFHRSDDSYYEEWYEDIRDDDGWIVLLNTTEDVEKEMKRTQLQHFMQFGNPLNDVNWRIYKPEQVYEAVESLMSGRRKELSF
ncbi:MAG: hypothetical protein RLZZ292_1138 [Bacteroidota bacterium]|jgi:hypothetical protein